MCSWNEPLGRDCGFIDFWSLTFQMLSTGTPIISQNTTFDFNSNVEFYFQQFAVLILLYGRLYSPMGSVTADPATAWRPPFGGVFPQPRLGGVCRQPPAVTRGSSHPLPPRGRRPLSSPQAQWKVKCDPHVTSRGRAKSQSQWPGLSPR